MPPIGEHGIDVTGLDVSPETMTRLLAVDTEGWTEQLAQIKEHYAAYGEKLPGELRAQLDGLEQRLSS
jgi:phosphoenolpyruvate carboxykinase (GTP)